MMKKQIVGIVFATSIVGGVGAGVLANALTSDSPATASPTASSATPTTKGTGGAGTGTPTAMPTSDTPTSAADLTIAPGELGPVRAGMSKAEALATGLFDADVQPVEGCQVIPLQFKKPFSDSVDVQTVGTRQHGSLSTNCCLEN